MSKCELAEKCPFFDERMGDMPATTVLLKERYCNGAHSICARYLVFRSLGRDRVPPNLTPSDIMRAKGIISAG